MLFSISPSNFFFHWFKGFQLGYTMKRIPPWSGWLASFWLPSSQMKNWENKRQGRTHTEGYSGYNWLPKHPGKDRVTWWPSTFKTFTVDPRNPGISASLTEAHVNSLKPNIWSWEGSQGLCDFYSCEPCQSEPDSRLNKKRRLEKFKHNLLLGNNKLTLLHFVWVTLQNISIFQRAWFYVIKTAKKGKKEKELSFAWGKPLLMKLCHFILWFWQLFLLRSKKI